METSEIDGIERAMSCMGTNDKDVLVRQFQQILGDSVQLSPEMCAFFLDMSNWNLQNALGAYYDYGMTNNVGSLQDYDVTQLSLQLVQDVTIGEGESVPPSTRFRKTWRVRNNGLAHWPDGTMLYYMDGDVGTFTADSPFVGVQCVPPGGEVEISVDLMSPQHNGIFQQRWQLNTAQRIPFGESIWCIINVDANGILDITQQLASAPLGHSLQPHPSSNSNPFSPPPQARQWQHSDGDDAMMEDPTHHDLSAQLSSLVRSAPMSIRRDGGGTEGPPCTPCTPPFHEEMHRF